MCRCGKCSNPIGISAKFCTYCGGEIIEQIVDRATLQGSSISAPESVINEDTPSNSISPPPPKSVVNKFLYKENPTWPHRFARVLFFLTLATIYNLFKDTASKSYSMLDLFAASPMSSIAKGLGFLLPFYLIIFCTRFVQRKRGNPPASVVKIILVFFAISSVIGITMALFMGLNGT